MHLYAKNYHSTSNFCKVIVPIRRVQFFMPHSVEGADNNNNNDNTSQKQTVSTKDRKKSMRIVIILH